MRTPPSLVSSTVLSGSREISISRLGRSTSSFIRSTRLVPPAMNFAAGSAAIRRTASLTSLARAYWILIMARHRLLDRRDNVGIGRAATDVAAHQFADFIGAARPALCDQAGRRANLARRAIAALERVMIDERLLQRMQSAVLAEALDCGDLCVLLHDGQGQA